ncbi:MAG: phage holin family protein [Parcubacteria group bacterium]
MTRLAIRILIVALAVIGVSYVVSGIAVSNFLAAVLFALVLGLVNALVRPIVKLLTLPLKWLTFGLFTFVINALMFWLASRFVFGVRVDSLIAAFWGALLVGLVSWLVNQVFKKKKKKN